MIPTLIGILTITFLISEFVPGGPMDQVQAILQGHDGQSGGEVSSGGDAKRKRVDPYLEARLRRLYGVNIPRWERYLRLLVWFGRDSIVSDEEVAAGTAAKFVANGRNCIVARHHDTFYACVNRWQNSELSFCAETGRWLSVEHDETFDPITGQPTLSSGEPLTVLQVEVRDRGSGREVFLNQPFAESITNWSNWHGFFLLKFGQSIYYNKNVLELVKECLPVSASLGIISFFLTYTVCLLLGLAKAARHGTKFDLTSSAVVLVGYSIPGFVLGVLLLVLFGPGDGRIVEVIPLAGLNSAEVPGYAGWSAWQKLLDYAHHLIAPVLCLCIGNFATMTMLTKNSVLDQIHQQYVITARAKGLSERKILFKHILRNALIPLITGFPSAFLGMFFAGSLLIEKVFSLNGLGLLSYEAVINRDFPIVLGSLFIFTILGLIGQLLTDLSYVIVDPRISFEESQG
jgi:microcin C transport system permease protein